MCCYKRRNREFEAKVAECADALRTKQEVAEILAILQDVENELLPLLAIIFDSDEK